MNKEKLKSIIIPSAVALLIIIVLCRVVFFPPHESNGTKISHAEVAEYKYVASVLREPFHYPTCRWAKKISEANLVGFKTRQEALDSGQRPCKICQP